MSIARSVDERVTFFLSLPSKAKKEKVVVMLEKISQKNETFAALYRQVSIPNRVVSDTILVSIYTGILQVADQLHKGTTGAALHHLRAVQEMLASLHEKEQQDKIKEGDADELLSFL